MRKGIKLLAAILLIAAFQSCDYVKDPIQSTSNNNNNNNTTSNQRKVLVEDYTGHTCGNCPRAGEAAEAVRQLYGNKVVTMEVHVGFFAEPCPPGPLPAGAPAGAYSEDYRTPTGNDYDNQFQVSNAGLPDGMVDRLTVQGSKVIPYNEWSSIVDTLVSKPADANIKIQNTYDSGTRKLSCTVTSSFLNPLSGTYKLVVLLTEDSIISWQEDYQATPSNIPNYVHRNVLRTSLNTSWGDTLSTGVANTSGTITKNYTLTLDPSWNDAHCSVTAYIYNADTYDVVQAEQDKVIQ